MARSSRHSDAELSPLYQLDLVGNTENSATAVDCNCSTLRAGSSRRSEADDINSNTMAAEIGLSFNGSPMGIHGNFRIDGDDGGVDSDTVGHGSVSATSNKSGPRCVDGGDGVVGDHKSDAGGSADGHHFVGSDIGEGCGRGVSSRSHGKVEWNAGCNHETRGIDSVKNGKGSVHGSSGGGGGTISDNGFFFLGDMSACAANGVGCSGLGVTGTVKSELGETRGSYSNKGGQTGVNGHFSIDVDNGGSGGDGDPWHDVGYRGGGGLKASVDAGSSGTHGNGHEFDDNNSKDRVSIGGHNAAFGFYDGNGVDHGYGGGDEDSVWDGPVYDVGSGACAGSGSSGASGGRGDFGISVGDRYRVIGCAREEAHFCGAMGGGGGRSSGVGSTKHGTNGLAENASNLVGIGGSSAATSTRAEPVVYDLTEEEFVPSQGGFDSGTVDGGGADGQPSVFGTSNNVDGRGGSGSNTILHDLRLYAYGIENSVAGNGDRHGDHNSDRRGNGDHDEDGNHNDYLHSDDGNAGSAGDAQSVKSAGLVSTDEDLHPISPATDVSTGSWRPARGSGSVATMIDEEAEKRAACAAQYEHPSKNNDRVGKEAGAVALDAGGGSGDGTTSSGNNGGGRAALRIPRSAYRMKKRNAYTKETFGFITPIQGKRRRLFLILPEDVQAAGLAKGNANRGGCKTTHNAKVYSKTPRSRSNSEEAHDVDEADKYQVSRKRKVEVAMPANDVAPPVCGKKRGRQGDEEENSEDGATSRSTDVGGDNDVSRKKMRPLKAEGVDM